MYGFGALGFGSPMQNRHELASPIAPVEATLRRLGAGTFTTGVGGAASFSEEASISLPSSASLNSGYYALVGIAHEIEDQKAANDYIWFAQECLVGITFNNASTNQYDVFHALSINQVQDPTSRSVTRPTRSSATGAQTNAAYIEILTHASSATQVDLDLYVNAGTSIIVRATGSGTSFDGGDVTYSVWTNAPA